MKKLVFRLNAAKDQITIRNQESNWPITEKEVEEQALPSLLAKILSARTKEEVADALIDLKKDAKEHVNTAISPFTTGSAKPKYTLNEKGKEKIQFKLECVNNNGIVKQKSFESINSSPKCTLC